MRSLQITDWCHAIFQTFVLRDGVYVDATMGKGRDTLFLCRLILCSHEHMDRYLAPESVDGICFNFGYLPGGDHRIATQAETSVAAVEQGLRLLKPGGVMSLCIYSGGDPPLPVFVFRQK